MKSLLLYIKYFVSFFKSSVILGTTSSTQILVISSIMSGLSKMFGKLFIMGSPEGLINFPTSYSENIFLAL